MVWTNFKTTMYKQYEMILAERGGGTLAEERLDEDVYEAFNAIAAEDMTALTESIVRYARQSTQSDARVNKLETLMEAMAMHQQPLGLGLPTQVANYANNSVYHPPVGPLPGFDDHQKYSFYATQEQTA